MPRLFLLAAFLVTLGGVAALGQQRTPPTTAQSIVGNFDSVNRRLLEMAKDFPADKYEFRAAPEVRSFREVIVHVFSGDVYAAKVGRGQQANWDEIDPKGYKGKDDTVAAFQKAIDDSTAALKAIPAERLSQSVNPWLAVIEHSAEHYGQLVTYYRLNHLVPPESRPKK
ncbi:MAG TPA: DinB family protein [Vicinamibacterales bacterium]|nr:DinB family protein [Vicinamibacterales bacterium]